VSRHTVLLVDDDPLVRQGLRLLLDTADDLDVVAEAGDGDRAVDEVHRHRPDVVVMDVRMPGTDGIAATAALTALTDPPRVLVLTTFGIDRYVLDALRAGASGFQLKDADPTAIIDAIRIVARGEATLAPSVTRAVLAQVTDPDRDAHRRRARDLLAGLSRRQREVADLVAEGLANAEVADRLHLSEATVKAYVSEVLTALAARNRVQIALAVRDATT
jgi:DNA-binding NarL/FixJ family response regulator